MFRKEQVLFIVLAGFFVTNALLAEFIGGKIFSLEQSLGAEPVGWHILGFELSFELTAGVLLWPVVFIMTDIINEYYGTKGVRMLSFMAAGLIAYGFVMVYFAMGLDPADWWVMQDAGNGEMVNMDVAFNRVFGQGLWIIVGSLTAFLVGQFLDVWTFHRIRKATGEKMLWLRATGSTLVSQLIDSFVVLFIAFYVSGRMEFDKIIAIMIINYAYKALVAVVLTPFLYVIHGVIDRYLGKERAEALIEAAAADSGSE